MGAGRPCTICTHPERDAIDRALIGAGAALKPVSLKFGVTQQSVMRHREQHMPRAARKEGAEAVAEAEGTRGAYLLREASGLRKRAMALLEKAEAAEDIRGANGSLREARECLKLEAQLLGELDDSATINVLIAPAFIKVQTVVLAALAHYPEARIAVVHALEGVR